jgi:two-component sensor histidine kinase
MKIKGIKINPASFWFFQTIGWILFYIADVFLIFFVRNQSFRGFIAETIQDITLMLLTLLLRTYYKRVAYLQLSVISIVIRIILSSMLTTIVWYAITTGFSAAILSTKQFEMMLDLKTAIYWVGKISPIIFGWSTLYFGIKFWLTWNEQYERSEQAFTLAQRAQLQMLRYQLNPHFLFNALNSIRALMHEDSKNAKSMITELSEFLRYSLHDSDSKEVKLNDELNAIKHYLSIEKKRFEDKLQVSFEIEQSAEDYPVLSFLIHPLVENAIKYGMKTSKMPLNITIKAGVRADALVLSVSNSGNWYLNSESEKNQSSTGTGLENVRARLGNAYPGRYKLEIKHDDDSVTVNLEIRELVDSKMDHK